MNVDEIYETIQAIEAAGENPDDQKTWDRYTAPITDTHRLDFLLRKAGEDFRFDFHAVLGDYEGDDEQQYFESARAAIDEAMRSA